MIVATEFVQNGYHINSTTIKRTKTTLLNTVEFSYIPIFFNTHFSFEIYFQILYLSIFEVKTDNTI